MLRVSRLTLTVDFADLHHRPLECLLLPLRFRRLFSPLHHESLAELLIDLGLGVETLPRIACWQKHVVF